MIAATGILTSRGGKTSHAAVVARGMGKTAVCGAESPGGRRRRTGRHARAGSRCTRATCCPSTARPARSSSASCPVVPSPVVLYLEEGLDDRPGDGRRGHRRRGPGGRPAAHPRRRGTPDAGAGQRRHRRRRRPRPADGSRGDRAVPHRAHVPRRPAPAHRAGHPRRQRRRSATPRSLRWWPPQTEDFVELLTAMDGLPTTIRLLDPPLHEFLPDRAELMVKVARGGGARRGGRRTTYGCWRRSSACTSRTRCSGCAASGWA